MEKKIVGMAKLVNLQNALAECGIESEVYMWEHEDGTQAISLRADLWNCVDGSDVLFEVYADETGDFEDFESYAEPENDRKAFEAELDEFLAEATQE
jgi:hypothetical protein